MRHVSLRTGGLWSIHECNHRGAIDTCTLGDKCALGGEGVSSRDSTVVALRPRVCSPRTVSAN